MGFTVAYLIYSGVMPLIKTFAALICGFVLVKMDMFPPAASRGASIVAMNVALPALIFANIVPSFNPSNVSALGPMFLIASVYQIFGFLMGILIREVVYVPRNFWQGIVILTGMSNWGNLPNAIVMSVTQAPPFNPATDPALGVSYVSIFTVCYHVVFWMCGAAQSLSWDYLPAVPQGEEAERRVSWKEKPIGRLVARALRLPPAPPQPLPNDSARKDEEAYSYTAKDEDKYSIETIENIDAPVQTLNIPRIVVVEEPVPAPAADIAEEQLTPRAANLPAVAGTYRSRNLTLVIPPAPLRPSAPSSPVRGASVPPTPGGFATAPSSPIRGAGPLSPIRSLAPSTMRSFAGSVRSLAPTTPLRAVHSIHSLEDPSGLTGIEGPSPHKHRTCAGHLRDTLAPLLKPVTISLALSLPIALVQPLKALFVDCTATGGPDWHGPDGRPPLAFVMDTAQFVDTIAVPLTLILLGASFARIAIPRPLSRLPLAAMMLCALVKMALLPVVGVLIVQAMVSGGMIPAEAKAERFVAMLLSGTPGAVNQMLVSSLYAPDGNVDTVSTFLLVQYVFMFISNAVITSVSLLLL